MERVQPLALTNWHDWMVAEHCYTAPYLMGSWKMVTEHNIGIEFLSRSLLMTAISIEPSSSQGGRESFP